MGVPIAGIIGMDVLSKSNFRLDYDLSEIEFGDILHEGVAVRFDSRAGIAVANVRIAGKPARMLVDTGAEFVALLGGNFGEAGWLGLRNISQSGVSLADPENPCSRIFRARDYPRRSTLPWREGLLRPRQRRSVIRRVVGRPSPWAPESVLRSGERDNLLTIVFQLLG